MLLKLLPFILLGFTALAPQTLSAQEKLILEHPGRFKRIEIKPGTMLKFRLTKDKFRYTAKYTRAHDAWIHFGQDSLRISEIDALYTRGSATGRYWRTMTQYALGLAAVVYPVMILLNRTAVTGYDPKDLREMALVSGTAIGLAFLLKAFRWRKYPLKKDTWRLQTRVPVEDLLD